MRKILFVALIAVLAALCVSAFAAGTEVSLAPAPANLVIPDGKTILTAENIDQQGALLRQIGMSKADLLADWEARGVILQAWSPIKTKYTCMELSVKQDSESAQYYDLIHHGDDKASWDSYISAIKSNPEWEALGYTIYGVEKKVAQKKYYALISYKRVSGKGEYRGRMAMTVYRGYTVTLDYQAYNRALLEQDTTDVYNVMKNFTVAQNVTAESAPQSGEGTAETGTAAAPASTVPGQERAQLLIETPPPTETNTNTFTVSGQTAPGAQVIGVLMRITSADPLLFETTSNAKNGKFTMKVTLPEAQETYWTMTLNVFVDDKLVAEAAFDPITYKKTLIPVNLDTEVPESITENELKISGKTVKGVQVQCVVTRPQDTWQKTITTNGTGKFSFTVPTKDEGIYNISLVFTKKGLNQERRTYTVSRILTDEARRVLIRKEALRVGYSTLVSRIDQYVSKTMAFNNVYITAIEEVGDEWKITAAGAKSGDHYSQIMVFMAEQEPAFAVEEQHNLFGKCIGPYQIQSEESVETVPSFDLLLWD